LHRWRMDDAATGEFPCRPSAGTGPDARRTSAVQYVSRWAHHQDVSRLRRRGVRAGADRRLQDSRRCGSGALDNPSSPRAYRPVSMTRIESRALQEFRRQLFGPNAVMPELYLDVLQSCVEGAEATFGQQIPPGGRRTQAFWLKGQILGELTCEGESDERAEIAGRLCRLSDPVTVELGVSMDFDDFNRVIRWWGRVLTLRFLNSEPITIDGTKGDQSRRQLAERFISQVLATITRQAD